MKIDELLEHYWQATHLPVSCFSGKNLVSQGEHYIRDFNLPMMIVHSLPESLPPAWCSYSPEYMYFGGITLKEHGLLLFVGPILLHECSPKQAEAILKQIGRTKRDIPALIRALSSYATCSVPTLKANLQLLSYILNQEGTLSVTNISFQWKSLFTEAFEPPLGIEDRTFEAVEKQLLSCIQYGRLDQLNVLLNEQILRTEQESGSLNQIFNDTSRFRHYLLGANMLASRAALNAGVDYGLINALTEHYIDLIMKMTSGTDLTHVFQRMFHDYAERVAQIKKYDYDSSRVLQIIHYIQGHLYEKITPTQIADHMGMSCPYLCTHFKSVTGKTISSFIQELKIEEAERLLLMRNGGNADIAALLGFSSQSYFCAVFKKVTGMTPREYQRKVDIG